MTIPMHPPSSLKCVTPVSAMLRSVLEPALSAHAREAHSPSCSNTKCLGKVCDLKPILRQSLESAPHSAYAFSLFQFRSSHLPDTNCFLLLSHCFSLAELATFLLPTQQRSHLSSFSGWAGLRNFSLSGPLTHPLDLLLLASLHPLLSPNCSLQLHHLLPQLFPSSLLLA